MIKSYLIIFNGFVEKALEELLFRIVASYVPVGLLYMLLELFVLLIRVISIPDLI